MQSDMQPAPISKGALWAGRIMSALPVLFLLVDGVMKLVKPEVVVKTTVELGYAEAVILPLGVVLLACTILYLIAAVDGTDARSKCYRQGLSISLERTLT